MNIGKVIIIIFAIAILITLLQVANEKSNKKIVDPRLITIMGMVLVASIIMHSPVQTENLTYVKASLVDVLDNGDLKVSINGKENLIKLNRVNFSDNKELLEEAKSYEKKILTENAFYIEKQKEALSGYIWLEEPEDLSESNIETYLLNALLIKNGYGELNDKDTNNKYDKTLKNLQEAAKDKEVGIWKK
ncbi:MAG: thermonuclease family protein [Finegoldia sp.]|nr:thermonuclease family protein [Finegoldia sp.]